MQALLIVTSVIAMGLVGFLFMILASPYSRRCWGIWLLTTAEAAEAKRAAYREIDRERRSREDAMRVSYGISPIAPFREPVKDLVQRNG